MGQGSDRRRERRDAMWKSHRTKRRFAGQPRVELQSHSRGQLALIDARCLHEEIVRMLPVVDGTAVARFARRKQIRIAALADGGALDAEHRSKAEKAAGGAPF